MAEQVQVVRVPQFQDTYSNHLNMSLTPYDAAITFSRMSSFGGNSFVEELATIRVSPQQLAVMARLLSRATEAWQAEYGQVDIDSTPLHSVEQMREGMQGAKQAMQASFANITPKP